MKTFLIVVQHRNEEILSIFDAAKTRSSDNGIQFFYRKISHRLGGCDNRSLEKFTHPSGNQWGKKLFEIRIDAFIESGLRHNRIREPIFRQRLLYRNLLYLLNICHSHQIYKKIQEESL